MLRLLFAVLTLLLTLVAIALPPAAADGVIMQKKAVDPADIDRLMDTKPKRPFCNAFTGCGRKRSDKSMATLLEMNSEPAVADISRQIMSEAKLSEAIQEARQELLRRRQMEEADPARLMESKKMRPFCNNLEGCYPKEQDDSMGALLDLNSEPAVADLSRQILSEAKLWEAIQEARQELLRRRQLEYQQNQFLDRPLAVATYRKKRSRPVQQQAQESRSR